MKSLKTVFIFLCVLFLFGAPSLLEALQPPAAVGAILPIEKTDRVLILAPHPDDEAIACAGIIQQALSSGAQVKVTYLTNGDHNQIAFIVYEKRLTFRKGEFIHMGEVRQKEAIKAMEILGVDSKDLIFLGYPDFGTFTILKRFWGDTKPYKSMLTKISSVPYKENLSYGAPYKGESILSDLKSVLREYAPTKIFVSHPADANSDHKALYLFLQVALRDLRDDIPSPEVYPYLVHSIGWPLPRHYHPELGLTPPKQFLASRAQWTKIELTPEQVNKKYQAILCYKSQTSSSAFYLLAFARGNELFGDYPETTLIREGQEKPGLVRFAGISDMFNVSRDIDWNNPGDIVKGKGRVSYGVDKENLLIRVDKLKGQGRKFNLQFYLFGYSGRVPFASMPKVRIIIKNNKFRVFDGKNMVRGPGLSLELDAGRLIAKVPLRLLKEPDFILAAVKTYASMLRTDTTSFRKINIK
ncbi:MAG: PIG-L family deacetylase [Candidatus Omnitrophota bacterium]